MNLQQLYYFMTVVRLKHITKASELHHVSQSTISTAICNLEDELGVSLLKKDGRGIEITQCGLIFAKYVEESLSSLENGINQITKFKENQDLVVELATTFSLGSSTLPSLISSFQNKHPEVTLKIHQGPNNYIIKRLINEDVDFVLGRVAPMAKETSILDYHPIFIEDIYVLLPKSHRLAANKSIKIDELRYEPIIVFDESTGFKQEIIDICARYGFYPNIAYEAMDNSTVAALVEEGFGIAFVAQAGSINENKIKVVSIDDESLRSTICLAWNNKIERTKGAKYLIDFVKSQYPSLVYREWKSN
mgnify:FL=1